MATALEAPTDVGRHNAALEESINRLLEGHSYEDLSTVIVIPTRGMIHARVVMSWMALASPMNQRHIRLPPVVLGNGMEVGDAYNKLFEAILVDPFLSTFRYVLTLEEDNLPPQDGLLKLLAAITEGPWAAVSGLYWTKGEAGQPMIYGDPSATPVNFIPQVPKPNTIQECRGLGMGFTLFDLNLFRDPDLSQPWFRTVQESVGSGFQAFTQDLWFFHRACSLGYRFAVHTGIRVGHMDVASGVIW